MRPPAIRPGGKTFLSGLSMLTSAQKAHLVKSRERLTPTVRHQPKCDGYPSTSWWTTPSSRDEFRRAVAAALPRMRLSRFSREAVSTILHSERTGAV